MTQRQHVRKLYQSQIDTYNPRCSSLNKNPAKALHNSVYTAHGSDMFTLAPLYHRTHLSYSGRAEKQERRNRTIGRL